MTTFGEIRTLVLKAIARDDSDATLIANAAINYALIMTALTFEPPEMFGESDVILAGGSNMLYFPNLVTDIDIDETIFAGLFQLDGNGDIMPIAGSTLATRLLDIIKVYNKTGGYKLDFIPYEQWDSIVPSGLTIVKYWTLFGNTLYVKATPTANRIFSISYSVYPSILVNATDVLPFAYHDAYIVSTATGICWAAFEEGDPADMWAKIAGFVGDPAALGTKARAIIEGQRVLLESAITQSKA